MNAYPVQCPNGRYVVRGWAVPAALCYVFDDARDLETAKHCGPGFASKIAEREGRVFKTRTFETESECQAAIDAYRNETTKGD